MSNPTHQQPSSGNTAAVIGGIAVVVAAIIAAGAAIYGVNHKDDDSGKAGDATTATPSDRTSTSSSRPPRGGHPTTPHAPSAAPIFTFDDLGGGSTVVRVFPGVGEGDRTDDGTYFSGDTIGAECKTTGRTVTSDPSVGERAASSDVWIKLETSETRYATLTYGHVTPSLGALPDC